MSACNVFLEAFLGLKARGSINAFAPFLKSGSNEASHSFFPTIEKNRQ